MRLPRDHDDDRCAKAAQGAQHDCRPCQKGGAHTYGAKAYAEEEDRIGRRGEQGHEM
jgi:hypothetical protein